MPLLLDHSVAPKQSSQAHAEREHCTLDLRVTLLTHQQLHLPTREGHYSAEGREVPRSAVLLGVDISLNLGNEAQSGCCTLESLRKACLPAFLPPSLPGEEKEQAWAHLLGVSLGALSACVWVCGEQGGEPGQEREHWLQGGSILPSPESQGERGGHGRQPRAEDKREGEDKAAASLPSGSC